MYECDSNDFLRSITVSSTTLQKHSGGRGGTSWSLSRGSTMLREKEEELEWTILLISKSILTSGKVPVQGISCLGRLASAY